VIRVLAVDDHALLRDGIAALIAGEEDIAPICEASFLGLTRGIIGSHSRSGFGYDRAFRGTIIAALACGIKPSSVLSVLRYWS
jgi:hypothetical protein